MSLLILRLGPPRSARRRVSARQRVLQGGHQTHHHCTKAQKQDTKYRNTSLRNTVMQSCKHKNTSTQNKEIKTSWNKQKYCTKTKTKSVSKTERAAGWSSGSPPIAPGRKNKMRNSEIQAFKIQKYRQSEISQYCTKRKTKFWFYCWEI